ncbi:MAG: hypothetical protein R3A12_09920 [Ignavibacteria bacterium]
MSEYRDKPDICRVLREMVIRSNLADNYFGRGNSPTTCGIILSGNILTNTINTRDVGANAGAGMVKKPEHTADVLFHSGSNR